MSDAKVLKRYYAICKECGQVVRVFAMLENVIRLKQVYRCSCGSRNIAIINEDEFKKWKAESIKQLEKVKRDGTGN